MIQSISMSHYNYNHYDMLKKLPPTNKENGSGDESKQAVLPRQKTLEKVCSVWKQLRQSWKLWLCRVVLIVSQIPTIHIIKGTK